MNDAQSIAAQVAAHAEADREDHRRVAELSPRQRGEMIIAACRAAAAIYRSRLAAGLPPHEPAPWPESTLEFLRRSASNARGKGST